MEYFFTIECAMCDDAKDLGPAETPEEIIKVADEWVRQHSCRVMPGRDDVLGWARGED